MAVQHRLEKEITNYRRLRQAGTPSAFEADTQALQRSCALADGSPIGTEYFG